MADNGALAFALTDPNSGERHIYSAVVHIDHIVEWILSFKVKNSFRIVSRRYFGFMGVFALRMSLDYSVLTHAETPFQIDCIQCTSEQTQYETIKHWNISIASPTGETEPSMHTHLYFLHFPAGSGCLRSDSQMFPPAGPCYVWTLNQRLERPAEREGGTRRARATRSVRAWHAT